MTKLRVAHGIKDRKSPNQNDRSKRIKTRTLRVSALSLATAVSALGLSQVACAELTWGEDESLPARGSAIHKTMVLNQTVGLALSRRRPLQQIAVMSVRFIIMSKL